MFLKLQVLLLANDVVGDNVIVINCSQDTRANAQVLKTIVVQTTTTPIYILVVYGDYNMVNSFLV